MNSDDIINMAAQAGIDETVWVFNDEAIERFAALVAAAEREACAKVCDDIDAENDGLDMLATVCAEAIRARGKV